MNHLGRNNWFNDGIKCVILAGGKGSRLLPQSLEKQKGLIEIQGKPILGHIVDYWSQYAKDFIFVVKYKKERVIDYLKKLSINSQFVEPRELRGIADGILQTQNLINNNFIVVLGDCLCFGNFIFPPSFEQGVGVYSTNDKEAISNSYSVKINSNNNVVEVVEKPKVLINNLCGMGCYFFNPSVFGFIEETMPSNLRNEVEITDVIQRMINEKKIITPIYFSGEYSNINTVDDLAEIKNIFKA